MKTKSFKWIPAICGFGLSLCMVSCSPSKPESTTEEQTTTTTSDAPTPVASSTEEGKAIVTDMAKCGMCHKLSDEKLIGPGLKGVTKKRSDEWLRNMIKNPAAFVQSDPEAKKLYEEYNKLAMTPIELTDAEIDYIIAFLKENDAQ